MTTTVAHLGAALARAGLRVAAVSSAEHEQALADLLALTTASDGPARALAARSHGILDYLRLTDAGRGPAARRQAERLRADYDLVLIDEPARHRPGQAGALADLTVFIQPVTDELLQEARLADPALEPLVRAESAITWVEEQRRQRRRDLRLGYEDPTGTALEPGAAAAAIRRAFALVADRWSG